MAYEKKKEMGKRPDVSVKAKGEEKMASKKAAKKMSPMAAKKSMYKKKM